MFPVVYSGKYRYRLIATSRSGNKRLLFAAFDKWVGIFRDDASGKRYIGVLPMLILEISYSRPPELSLFHASSMSYPVTLVNCTESYLEQIHSGRVAGNRPKVVVNDEVVEVWDELKESREEREDVRV